MPKEEIIAGLKQAIERGSSLEQAKQSFINAGYSREEVEEAASSFKGVITQYSQIQQPQQLSQLPSQQPQQMPQQKIKKPKKPKKIIFLVTILIFLLILLAVSFIFREKILEFIRNLL